MRRNTSARKRIRRTLAGDIHTAFQDAALQGINRLEYLWRNASSEQRRIILENDNFAALLKSIIYHNTDHNVDMDVFKWFNQRIDNSQRKIIYSKIFKDIITFFISQNYVEGLHFIKQGMGDKWNNELAEITLDTFLPTIMSLENPKTILSWFKLNVSNSEMVESIDRIIDTLNQMPMMKKNLKN